MSNKLCRVHVTITGTEQEQTPALSEKGNKIIINIEVHVKYLALLVDLEPASLHLAQRQNHPLLC